MGDPIRATLSIALKPWDAPSFARRAHIDSDEASAVHVRDLDSDALEDMALAWLNDLYRKAGKRSPFYKPARRDPSPPESKQ